MAIAPRKIYTDKPRYKVIYGYENSFKNIFSKLTQAIVKDIVVKAKVMIEKK